MKKKPQTELALRLALVSERARAVCFTTHFINKIKSVAALFSVFTSFNSVRVCYESTFVADFPVTVRVNVTFSVAMAPSGFLRLLSQTLPVTLCLFCPAFISPRHRKTHAAAGMKSFSSMGGGV